MRRWLPVVALGGLLWLGAAVAAPSAPAAGRAKDPAAAMFAAWDRDRNGALSPAEFRDGWSGLRRQLALAQLRAQFQRVDADRSGAIDADEYAGLALVREAGKAATPLATFDANRNQRLEFDEYLRLVQQRARPAPAARPAP